jgi:hypothetical protein
MRFPVLLAVSFNGCNQGARAGSTCDAGTAASEIRLAERGDGAAFALNSIGTMAVNVSEIALQGAEVYRIETGAR